jgi:hypothetical protein
MLDTYLDTGNQFDLLQPTDLDTYLDTGNQHDLLKPTDLDTYLDIYYQLYLLGYFGLNIAKLSA